MADKQTNQFGISSLSYPWAVGMAKVPRLKRRLSAFELLEKARGVGIVHTTIIELWPPWHGDIETTVRMENEWVAYSVEFMRGLY